MNYTGSIAGIQLTDYDGSIFTAGEGGKGKVWSSEVTATISTNEILLEFRYSGAKYSATLSKVNITAFKGAVYADGIIVGDLYVWWFKNAKDEYLFQGDWNEDEYGSCECFIKLRGESKNKMQ